jgi:integrase
MAQLVGREKMPDELATLQDRVRELAAAGIPANTTRTYGHGWHGFLRWCDEHELEYLPATPATVALYVAARLDEGRALSTISADLSAIAVMHRRRSHDSPTQHPIVRLVLKGARRTGPVDVRQAHAIGLGELAAMVQDARARPDALGARDAALLLVGWGAALRRSELVALDWSDLEVTELGLLVRIRRSKMDQLGEGACVPIPRARRPELCAVAALEAWRAWCGSSQAGEGLLLPALRSVDRHGHIGGRLSDRAVDLVIRARAMSALGLVGVSGHSLRAGYITEAARQDVSERKIAGVSRHKSSAVLRRYIRHGSIWLDVPTLL